MVGAPGRDRTCDNQLRRLVLYPTELRARADSKTITDQPDYPAGPLGRVKPTDQKKLSGRPHPLKGRPARARSQNNPKKTSRRPVPIIRPPGRVKQGMVGARGFEPPTASSQSW